MSLRARGFLSFLAMLILLPMLGGCQTTGVSFAQSIINNQVAIQATANLATSASLVPVKTEDRPAVAREAYAVALAIHDASGTQIDLSGVDALANQELAKLNSPYAPVVGSLVQVLESAVQAYANSLTNNPAVTSDQRVIVLRALLSSASQGVMDATLSYTQGAPLSAAYPVGASQKAGVIIVPTVTWSSTK